MFCTQWTSPIQTTLHPKMCFVWWDVFYPKGKYMKLRLLSWLPRCQPSIHPLWSRRESQQKAYQLSFPTTVDTPHLPWLWSQTWGWVRHCRACVSWRGTITTEWGSWRWVVALQHLPHWWCALPHSLDTGAMRWGSSVTQRISTHCSTLDHPTQGQGR